jgi:hypothetical protein
MGDYEGGCGIVKVHRSTGPLTPIARQRPVQNASSPGLRPRIIWSTAALLVIAVLTLGAFNASSLRRCGSCHDRPGFREATAASAHATTDCRSCHVPTGSIDRLAFSLRQSVHMLIPITGGVERDAAAVPDVRCLACHEDVRAGVVASNGVRFSHASCAVDSSCSDCHSATAHGVATSWVRSYTMDGCLSCHIPEKQTACDLCHDGRRPASRIKSGTFAVIHGAQWRTTHGMGDSTTCVVCHQEDDCLECHGPGLPHGAHFIEVHADYSRKGGAKCSGCHATSFCDTCHGTPMPHTAQFTVSHAKTAKAQPAMCTRCHADPDCTTCHLKHVHPGGAIGGTSTRGGGK